jgi:ribosomal protein L11 methyltransferase
MAWRELRFVCDAALADTISDALLEAGALSVSVEDASAGTADEKPLFGEPGSAIDARWHSNAIVALVEEGADAGEIIAEATQAAGLSAAPAFTSINVAEQDWVRLTQSQFDPIRISERLWIVPSWHTAPDPKARHSA